ncbi:hypothetical protein INS49_002581 [Diaporthe citri]|uniref:uncharacterized protein n=1 Tax=Diaporthe citri TaxID=83186 RepID=UPI001C808772|nr:uncharacterized protein INS49_002581 [Diaporthe citri]KAG6368376.1 hypothetical protein INS49_002581 [Diaporthe citri]
MVSKSGTVHPGSISARVRKAAKDMENLLAGSLCNEPKDAKEHIEYDCVMVNPLIHPDGESEPMHMKSEPTLTEAIDKLAEKGQLISWKIHKEDPEPAIAEVDMMGVQIIYRVTVIKSDNGSTDLDPDEMDKVEAWCTSTWRQLAGGNWKLVAQLFVPI